jgi:hypothetical protein
MKKLLAILLIFVASVSYAEQGDLSLSLTGISYHFGPGHNTKKNAYNWGGGISYEVVDRVFVYGGENRNSKWQDSVRYGLGYRFFQIDNFSASLSVQNATGYGYTKYVNRQNVWQDQNQQSVQVAGCYKVQAFDGNESKKHNPSVCASVPLYWTNSGNSAGGVDSIMFYIKIPITNLLN